MRKELSLIGGLRRSTLWLFVVWNASVMDPSVPKIDDAPPLSFEEHFDLNSYVESQAIEIERQIKDLASTRIAKIVESCIADDGLPLAAIWIYLSSFISQHREKYRNSSGWSEVWSPLVFWYSLPTLG